MFCEDTLLLSFTQRLTPFVYTMPYSFRLHNASPLSFTQRLTPLAQAQRSLQAEPRVRAAIEAAVTGRA